MPPKPKITRDMILEAGLTVIRRDGAEKLNVRSIAAELSCSTQPVMYQYPAVSALKDELYAAADQLHTAYIMQSSGENPMLGIGLRYIRFAAEERQLFRFLFQSDKFAGSSFGDLLSEDAPNPVIAPLCAQTGLDPAQAKAVFASLFCCVHGYASLLANNAMRFDEADCAQMLTDTMNGLLMYMKGKNRDEDTV